MGSIWIYKPTDISGGQQLVAGMHPSTQQLILYTYSPQSQYGCYPQIGNWDAHAGREYAHNNLQEKYIQDKNRKVNLA